jgi:hypothetical protein
MKLNKIDLLIRDLSNGRAYLEIPIFDVFDEYFIHYKTVDDFENLKNNFKDLGYIPND